MRQKNTLKTLLLITGIFALGIAYAALTSQALTVGGQATVATKPGDGTTNPGGNFDVEFVDTAVDTANTTAHVIVTPTLSETDENVANLDVSNFTTKGDKATATFKILNTSPVDDIYAQLATDIKLITDNDSSADWFEIDASLDTTVLAPDCSTAEAGPYATLTVTVELLKTPIDDTDVAKAAATLQVTVEATPIHESDADAGLSGEETPTAKQYKLVLGDKTYTGITETTTFADLIEEYDEFTASGDYVLFNNRYVDIYWGYTLYDDEGNPYDFGSFYCNVETDDNVSASLTPEATYETFGVILASEPGTVYWDSSAIELYCDFSFEEL